VHLIALLLAVSYPSVAIEGVPHVLQKPDFCGEACAEMFLRKLGRPVSQDQVFALTGVDPGLGRGAYTQELDRALRKLGFETGPVWLAVDPTQAAEQVERQWGALHADLSRGIPSIVCMHYADEPKTTEHFRLVLGYDAASDEVLYHEPAEPHGAYRRMKRQLFTRLWTFKPRPDRWTLIRFRLEPRAAIDPPTPPGLSPAEAAQHVLAAKEQLPPGFTPALVGPCLVLGDEAPDRVRARAARVRWTVDLLKKDFFAKEPEQMTDVWVFRNRHSYESHVHAMLGEMPSTPYGFYVESRRALLMNIAPGDGTLVHELVHPFMHANFPRCPTWLNEGLASLYERPGEEDGHIRGYPNWRLPDLQVAISKRELMPLSRMMGLSEAAFYADDDGTHYAQARYLCYFLQEKGLLPAFFAQLVKDQDRDPTGLATLRSVLHIDDMNAFERQWRGFVMDLRYR